MCQTFPFLSLQAAADFAIKISREQTPLECVLAHTAAGLKYFTQFVNGEFSSENLLFWHAVNTFEFFANGSQEQEKAANQIWNDTYRLGIFSNWR